jgi:PAS domain S-box-containing protein
MSNVEEFPVSARRLTEYEALIAAAPSALDAIPGAVYLCDRDGWLVRYNNEAAALWGRTPTLGEEKERFCGSHRLFLLDGTPLAHQDCPMAEAVRTGAATRNAEVIFERPDGSRITALVNIRALRDYRGAIQGAINCFQDISAHKEVEEESRRKSADLEDFFENSAIGLHIVSGDGIILRANKAELDLLGYAPEEYVGRHIAEFHADAPVIGDILHRLSCGERLDRYPARLRAKDGSVKHVLVTSNSRFKDGKFINTRCFTTDVTSLYEAEQARRESEGRLAATYQAATIGITEIDDQGRLLNVNNALCKMLGRSREDLLGMTFLEYTHEDDREPDASSYAKQVRGELDSYSIRKRATKADGATLYLDVFSSSVRDADGSFRYGVRVLQDVTEAQRMEDRLREGERHMRDLLEALPAAVYTTDSQGRITFFNKAAIEMAGRTPDAGDKWCVTWRLYNPDGTPLPHDQCPMAIALKEGRSIRGVEAIAERPDGTRIPFIPYPTLLRGADGEVIGAINMLVDITERKKGEDYARRLAAIIQYSEDAIISTDLQAVIQTWNKGAERLFGYDADEVIGKSIAILLPPGHLEDEEQRILEKIQTGEHVEHYETTRIRKDGAKLDISLTVSPLKDGRDRVIGASKIARDITEKRRLEERRELLVNELNHRVKNTLATVQSLAAQTFRGDLHTPGAAQFESRLIALAQAHDVLTQEDWQGVDLRMLVDRSIATMCVKPETRFRVSGPALRLRPRMALSLALALHELCTNALKYGALSRDEGTVRISWEAEGPETDRQLHLRWEETGGPEVAAPKHKGFGSRLLDRALGHELGAKVYLSFLPSGVICEITAAL